MARTVSTRDLRQNLSQLLQRVARRQDQIVIEQGGRPLAAMVSMRKLEQISRAARLILQESLNQTECDLSQSEADRLANEAKHWSRDS